MLSDHTKFLPRPHSDLPELPAAEGVLVFTGQGRILLGDATGNWIHYDTFISVPSMAVFKAMRLGNLLQTHRLYCVENNLYRWDGTETHQVGCSLPSYEGAAPGNVLTRTEKDMEWKPLRDGCGIKWGGRASHPRWK